MRRCVVPAVLVVPVSLVDCADELLMFVLRLDWSVVSDDVVLVPLLKFDDDELLTFDELMFDELVVP